MTEPLIRNVADTAFWIAHHRAVETERSDALFHDPLAALLAGEQGEKIAAAMPTRRMIAWSVAIRTRVIDEFIQSAIASGIDTILNLGAGLDTRPYRMTLPAPLRWIEADYPRIVDYKESLLAHEHPLCRLERVKVDLADGAARRNFFAGVNARSSGILVLTEGVVPYLDLEQAASLADDLRSLDQVRAWLVDYFSPQAMKYRRRRGMDRMMRNAPFKFAPDDWFGFFRQHGWQAKEVRYLVDEGERLGRPIPLPWPLRVAARIGMLFMPKAKRDEMRRFAGYVLLEPR
jgi:methyltransferase (TIGR00027 family)